MHLTNHECLLGSHADPLFYNIGQEPIGQEPIGQFLPPLLISC